MQIPSYKYKFKQIFKKIGQTKALDLAYVFPRILLCCCSYLNGESENQTHLCRTIELSDGRTNGLSDYSYAPIFNVAQRRGVHISNTWFLSQLLKPHNTNIY